MVQLAGKYQLVENKNIYDLLVKLGLPDDVAKKGEEVKGVLTVEVDGDTVRLISDATHKNNVSELVLNKEVDESFALGGTVKSTTTLNGNVLSINSIGKDGTGTRVYTFSDGGLELKITSVRGDAAGEGTRIYKRI